MSILITICARGGSKGIPGKNIKKLAGKPLIAYTIELANSFKKWYGEADIALSTDSEEIKQVVGAYGLETTYMRPARLGEDSIGKIDVIKDVLHYYQRESGNSYDYILDLDVTSPLRTLDDLQQGFNLIESHADAVNLFSVSPAGKNPYFNMVEKKEDGFYGLVKKRSSIIKSRQASPEVYELNASFYFYKKDFFEQNYKGAITDKSIIYTMPHICFDLDHPIDFDFISYLIENNRLDFTL